MSAVAGAARAGTPVFVNGKFCAQRVTGVQRYAGCLLQALDRRLMARPAGLPDWTLLIPPGATPPPLRAIAVRTAPWAGPGGLHGWEQIALPPAARAGRLLNLSGSAPAFAAPGALACVMHDAAVFDHPQAYARSFGLWYRWLFRRLARRARPAITVSRFSQARLSAALGLPPGTWAHVPGGGDHLDAVVADARLLQQHGLGHPTGTPFLLAVGSANPTKNQALLLRAWRALGRADARLVLVGGQNAQVFAGEGKSSATSSAMDRVDAADRPNAPADPAGLLRLGTVDDATLKALYAHADGLVFPSLYEGFGLPPLEAMACGCPVLVSEAASLPEVCGDAALYVPPGDGPAAEAALTAGMRRLLDEPALRDDLRRRGRRHVARYTWDISADALLRALDAPPDRP